MARVFSPLDAVLELTRSHFSPFLIEGMVRLGTCLPFAQVPAMVHFFTGVEVSSDTVRRLTEQAGAALATIETAEAERIEQELPKPPEGPAIQQLSVDGAMVPVLGGEWVEVRTAAIGTVEQSVDVDGEPVARSHDVSYFSRYTDAKTLSQLAIIATHRRGTETAGTVCAVMDGAEWLQAFCDVHRPDAVRILDFPHAVEYLAMAAHAVLGAGTDAATTWLKQQAHDLKHEDPGDVLQAVRDLPAETEEAREVRDKALHYLEERQEQIRYAHFREAGYPIGSGMVEGGNKLVIEARLNGSGMHWARPHVSPMAALRSVWCSATWEERWPHIRQEVRLQAAQRKQARHLARCPLPSKPDPIAAPPSREPAPARTPILPRERSMIDGKPTKHHPWNR